MVTKKNTTRWVSNWHPTGKTQNHHKTLPGELDAKWTPNHQNHNENSYSLETDTSEIILSFVTFQRTTIGLFDNKILDSK